LTNFGDNRILVGFASQSHNEVLRIFTEGVAELVSLDELNSIGDFSRLLDLFVA